MRIKGLLFIGFFILFIIPASATNVALNKTISYSDVPWGDAPMNLANMIDGNWTSVTGGVPGLDYARSTDAADDITYVQIDLLGYYNISYINIKFDYYIAGIGTHYHNLKVSEDGVSWTTIATNSTTSVVPVSINYTALTPNNDSIRYIRASVWGAAAEETYIRWYEAIVEGNLSQIVLNSPANNSLLFYDYPPQTSNINFSWMHTTPVLSYNLQVAKDINFNLISVDTTVSNNYSVQSLQGTQEYFWKVRTYNSTSGTYGSWSDTFNFTLQANTTASGSGIQGTVYDSDLGTAIQGASVFIYNNTWSSTQIVGSNGYYLFNTGNGTYYLKATKSGYDDSELQTVNVTYGVIQTQDIPMKKCTVAYSCYFTIIYQQIIVTHPNGTLYPNVLVKAYKDDEVTVYAQDYTDSDGEVIFQLVKDQRYRFELTAGTDSKTEYHYASGTPILIILGTGITPTPTPTPPANITGYNVTNTSKNWSIASLTGTNLTSQIGLSMSGQGIVTGLVAWVVIGSGGVLTAIFAFGILAYLGIITWQMIALFIISAMSIYVLSGEAG